MMIGFCWTWAHEHSRSWAGETGRCQGLAIADFRLAIAAEPRVLRPLVLLYTTGFFGDSEVMVSRNIDIPRDRIEEFCRRW